MGTTSDWEEHLTAGTEKETAKAVVEMEDTA